MIGGVDVMNDFEFVLAVVVVVWMACRAHARKQQDAHDDWHEESRPRW